MATYLVVRNNEKQTSYRCNTTHTSKPYLKVKDDCYLDLTTRTSSGLQFNVKVDKRTDTFITTTGYKGYFSCRQSTASGIKSSSNGSTYNTTDYEPFVSFTSTAGWATRNTTYTRTSHNIGVLSSTTALTQTSSVFNKGIYHIVNTTSSITDISSRSQVNYTVSTSTSRSSQRNSTSGYSGRSSYSTSRNSLSGYSGRTSSRRTTASGWRRTTSTSRRNSTYGYTGKRNSTYGYTGKRWSNYVSKQSWGGYTKTASQSAEAFTGYGGAGFAPGARGWNEGSGNVTWGNSQYGTNSAINTDQPVDNYRPVKWLIRNTANGDYYVADAKYTKSRYSQIQYWRRTTSRYSTTDVRNVINYTANRTSGYSSVNANGMLSATALVRTSAYSSVNANGMMSATALTRTSQYQITTRYAAAATSAYPADFTSTKSGTVQISGYKSSTNSAGMYSTTGLYRSSGYNTTSYRSSTAVGALLSTTALTRTSYYTVSTSTSRSSSSYSNYTFLTSTSVKFI